MKRLTQFVITSRERTAWRSSSKGYSPLVAVHHMLTSALKRPFVRASALSAAATAPECSSMASMMEVSEKEAMTFLPEIDPVSNRSFRSRRMIFKRPIQSDSCGRTCSRDAMLSREGQEVSQGT